MRSLRTFPLVLASMVLTGVCMAQAEPVPSSPPPQEDQSRQAAYGYMAPSLDAYQGELERGRGPAKCLPVEGVMRQPPGRCERPVQLVP